jgi:nucleoside-diphosphate-sugar epimerase
MKVLVTGASGRFGPYVVKELETHGYDLVLLSRRRPEGAERWPWIEGTFTDFDTCLKATKGVEAVQHVGANPWASDHPESREGYAKRGVPFDDTMRTNIMGTYYLLQACLQNKVGIFVMTGSNCALGHGGRISGREFPISYLPIDEKHPCEVEDSYSYSKHVGEELLASYTRAYGIRTYVLRSAGICFLERRQRMAQQAGPAKEWDSWLWAWVSSEDQAAAHRMLMEKAQEIKAHDVFFCNGDDTTALEPTRELVEKFKPELRSATGALEGHASLLSNRKLKQTIGWEHKLSWREFLKK